jgi:hypothetical protein
MEVVAANLRSGDCPGSGDGRNLGYEWDLFS